jgi:hypothetical protein
MNKNTYKIDNNNLTMNHYGISQIITPVIISEAIKLGKPSLKTR